MENFAYPKIFLTPKLKVDHTVLPNQIESFYLNYNWHANSWINASLGILQISSILFFHFLWFCIFEQTLVEFHPFPKYCKLWVFLFFTSVDALDQNAAFYSKICGVTHHFCFVQLSWTRDLGKIPINDILLSLHGDYNPRKLWTKIVFLSCSCIAKHTEVPGLWLQLRHYNYRE